VSSLQQRIRKIEEESEQLHEDKQFYEQIIEELQDTTNTEDELSSFGTIEFIQEPIQPQRQTDIKESNFKPAVNKAKPKKQERQEGLEKA
jgi:hypothetical protein